MVWKPHVSVAAIAERDGRFLMVKERAEGGVVFNQPAGHLEEGETLLDAIVREVAEETAWHYRPEAVIGVYRLQIEDAGLTYLRICFSGCCLAHDRAKGLDPDIISTHWMTRDELQRDTVALRSALVMQCIDDYLAGYRYPLELLRDSQ